MKIRSRLILLILCVLLPASTAGIIAGWFIYEEQRSAQETTLAEAARVLSLLVDNEMESSEQFLVALAGSPDLASANLKRFYEHAQALYAKDQDTIILSDPAGQQILNTRLPFGLPPQPVDPRLFEIRRAVGPRATVFSDLYYAAVAKRYDVAVQVPVVIDGAVRYYLSRSLEATALQRFSAKQGFPGAWIASIVDRNGRVIARSLNSDQYIGKSATGSLLQKILAGTQSGLNEGLTLDGEPVKAFFHRSPRSNWTVILSVPSAELNRPALHAALLLAALIALTFLGALVLTKHHLAKFLAPVHRLRDDAQRLGQGHTVTPFVSGLDELDLVNGALVSASSQLRDARAIMERRVAEAIASTERAQRALLHSQKLEALGRLTGGVAHDFNNVLQTLTSALQVMSLESDPARLPERIAMCRKAVARAATLVAQLRAFGRTQDAYLQTLRAGDAIRSALPMLENSLPAAVTLKTVIDEALWPIRIDPTQFELALLNLVINARDAIGHGQVTIEASNRIETAPLGLPQGDYVRIVVVDTGTGMPPEVLARAFDPFFTTKPVDQGSGLGLAQAYGFATQSNGTLRLESTVGIGTTAALYLPRASVEAAPAAALPPVEEAHGAPVLNATVLFVEDDQLVRDSVTPILEQAGATVLCAENGEAALRILEAGHAVDVLFSDIVMPGELNGVMLAKHVQQHYPRIAIVLATGYFDKKVELPGVPLLTKPYQTHAVITTLSQVIYQFV